MAFLCQDYTLRYSYAVPFHVKLADSWLWMSNSTSCEFVLNRLVKIWPQRRQYVNVRALFPVSILRFWRIHGGENEGLVGHQTRERRKEFLLEWVFCRQKLTFYWRKVAPVKKENLFLFFFIYPFSIYTTISKEWRNGMYPKPGYTGSSNSASSLSADFYIVRI